MRIIKWLFVIFILFLAIFVVVGLMLPTEYSVSKSIQINSSSEKVHEYVGDLEKWDQWMPWKDGDPGLIIERKGKTTGVGARQSWKGKDGTGELVFTKSDPKTGIEYDLFFDEGKFKCKSAVRYNQKGVLTEVVWTMNGNAEMPVLGGYFAKLIQEGSGPMFEKGLNKLKKRVEANKN